MNPKAGEDGSGALPREESPSGWEGQDGEGKGGEFALRSPGGAGSSEHQVDGQGSVAPRRQPGDSLPVCTRAQRPGVAARVQASGAESWRARCAWGGFGRSRRPGRESSQEFRMGPPAPLQWLARRRSRAPLKGRSHSWAFLWPMGGGRAGSGRGASLGSSLRPPPLGAQLSS